MIRFERVAEPADFAAARDTGNAWLAAHPAHPRPRDYWSTFKSQLADGFRQLCAYSAMLEPVGTVDHFVSFHEDRSRAYDWTNYRFASGWINASKKNLASTAILDPHEVGDDWFEILLPSLQLVVTDACPEDQRERAHAMLHRLHLGHDERVIKQRRRWLKLYEDEQLTLAGLAELAPLIARAVEKQRGAVPVAPR